MGYYWPDDDIDERLGSALFTQPTRQHQQSVVAVTQTEHFDANCFASVSIWRVLLRYSFSPINWLVGR